MNWHSVAIFSATMVSGIICLPAAVLAQQSLKEQLTGAWKAVSNENIATDGSKRQPFGTSPKGILVLTANGQFVQIIVRPGRPQFKINNRMQGTAEENTAALQGTTANFGTWSVDETSKTLIIRIEDGMFPNQAGTEQKRTVSVTGDELKVENPTPGSGGKSESIWKRTK